MLIRYMALVMGLCYLAHPFHQQIRTVFHEISHLMEAPASLLSHHPPSTEHSHNVHKDSEHVMTVDDHQHSLLELMDSLFDAGDEHPEGQTLLSLTTYDKHIQTQHPTLTHVFPIYVSQNPMTADQKTDVGYSTFPDEPPQAIPLLSFL